jgi:hypothetical protein
MSDLSSCPSLEGVLRFWYRGMPERSGLSSDLYKVFPEYVPVAKKCLSPGLSFGMESSKLPNLISLIISHLL